jgi:hypothetical protein
MILLGEKFMFGGGQKDLLSHHAVVRVGVSFVPLTSTKLDIECIDFIGAGITQN